MTPLLLRYLKTLTGTVVGNLPASEKFQPIRRQDRASAPITIQADEGAGPDGFVLL